MNRTVLLTQRELIDAIRKTFKNEEVYTSIAILTEFVEESGITHQSITFSKDLEV